MTEPPRNDSAPDRTPAPAFPRWLGLTLVALLSLQLVLGYLQGALLHRQQSELHALRTDLQDLTEAIEQSQGSMDGNPDQGEAWRPAGPAARNRPRPYTKAGWMVLDGDEDDRARKETRQSQESARKAVDDAKKAQQQVSIVENARKAETREKIDAAQGNWQKWSLIALGFVALALIVRAWIQRRG